jgi:hypothetical protein
MPGGGGYPIFRRDPNMPGGPGPGGRRFDPMLKPAPTQDELERRAKLPRLDEPVKRANKKKKKKWKAAAGLMTVPQIIATTPSPEAIEKAELDELVEIIQCNDFFRRIEEDK